MPKKPTKGRPAGAEVVHPRIFRAPNKKRHSAWYGPSSRSQSGGGAAPRRRVGGWGGVKTKQEWKGAAKMVRSPNGQLMKQAQAGTYGRRKMTPAVAARRQIRKMGVVRRQRAMNSGRR